MMSASAARGPTVWALGQRATAGRVDLKCQKLIDLRGAGALKLSSEITIRTRFPFWRRGPIDHCLQVVGLDAEGAHVRQQGLLGRAAGEWLRQRVQVTDVGGIGRGDPEDVDVVADAATKARSNVSRSYCGRTCRIEIMRSRRCRSGRRRVRGGEDFVSGIDVLGGGARSVRVQLHPQQTEFVPASRRPRPVLGERFLVDEEQRLLGGRRRDPLEPEVVADATVVRRRPSGPGSTPDRYAREGQEAE